MFYDSMRKDQSTKPCDYFSLFNLLSGISPQLTFSFSSHSPIFSFYNCNIQVSVCCGWLAIDASLFIFSFDYKSGNSFQNNRQLDRFP